MDLVGPSKDLLGHSRTRASADSLGGANTPPRESKEPYGTARNGTKRYEQCEHKCETSMNKYDKCEKV